MTRAIPALLLAALAIPPPALAFDAASCLSALERLKRASRDAVDNGETAERECSDCDDCRDDDGGGRCRSQCAECASAKGALHLDLSGVESGLRSIEISCDYRFELDPKKGLEKLQRRLDEMKKVRP